MATRAVRGAAFTMLCGIWGSTWLAIRIGLEGAPPFLSASLRFVVAFATLVVLAAVFRSKWPNGRTEWALVVFVGIVLFTFDYGLIYWGENNGVESGLSAILFATLPLQTALVANALLREERLTLQKLVGIGLGFGGIVLIFRGQVATAGLERAFPMLAIVLSATCAAFLSTPCQSADCPTMIVRDLRLISAQTVRTVAATAARRDDGLAALLPALDNRSCETATAICWAIRRAIGTSRRS